MHTYIVTYLQNRSTKEVYVYLGTYDMLFYVSTFFCSFNTVAGRIIYTLAKQVLKNISEQFGMFGYFANVTLESFKK